MSYSIYEKLCKLNNVTNAEVSRATGVTPQALSQWKKHDDETTPEPMRKKAYVPKDDKRRKIAEYFGVPLEFIDGQIGSVQCPRCGQQYDPLNSYQFAEHKDYHARYLAACDKYGDLKTFPEIDKMRSDAINAFHQRGISDEERMVRYDALLHIDYIYQIWKSGFDLNFISFEEYAKTLTPQLRVDNDRVTVDFADAVMGRYGSSSEDETAEMVMKILTNAQLFNAIKKYMMLSKEKQNHVLEMINLLSQE